MANKILKINKPFIKNNRLYSKIEYDNNIFDMYFEVEDQYKKYLCDDNADSFLVALIPFIVKHNYDVLIDGNISSRLFYQLKTYLLPLLCSQYKKNTISIECNLTEQLYNAKGVGASISCGVDSFYTILKHQNLKDSKFNITHLTFFNAGSHGDFGGEGARKLFNDRIKFIRKFCLENNYKLVTVDSNMNELIMMEHKKTHSFRTLACVLALQKLFGKYYFASGYHYNDMEIDEDSAGHYDTLNVQCLSNENLTIYLSGMEVTRMDKIKYISEFPITYNWLNVCIMGDKNCGRCIKCVRTMAELDSIGKLEKYKMVFNINDYNKHKIKYLSDILFESRISDDCDGMYFREIINNYKLSNNKFPLSATLLSYLPTKIRIKKIAKKILPIKIIKKINKQEDNNYGWY